MRGAYVIEAGVRDAWPFLTLRNATTTSERRLYIDTDAHLESAGERWLSQEDPELVRQLTSLVTLSVSAASVERDSLRLAFASGESLVIAGAGNGKTTQAMWWLSGDIPGH